MSCCAPSGSRYRLRVTAVTCVELSLTVVPVALEKLSRFTS